MPASVDRVMLATPVKFVYGREHMTPEEIQEVDECMARTRAKAAETRLLRETAKAAAAESAAAAAAANAVEEAVADVLAALDAAGDPASTIAPEADAAALAVGTAPESFPVMSEVARTPVWVIVDDAPATEGAAGGQALPLHRPLPRTPRGHPTPR